MFRILDRYLIREILPPLVLALVVLTFVLEIPPILQQGQTLIAKGVEWSVVVRLLATLLPQALALTIPMAVLIGILIGLGRLSADREFVAIQACGISLYRLLRPIALVALLGTAATAYEMIVALPDANQTFRDITFRVVASRVMAEVKPRVFFNTFPNRVVYARDVTAGGAWHDVFLADTSQPGQTTVYFAREGRLSIDRAHRLVQLELRDGTRHTTLASKPDEYEGTEFGTILLTLDPESVFPRPPAKGLNEMTIGELRASIADAASHGDPGYGQRYNIQLKFALPVACLVLAVIGLALGATSRKDGKLASFVLGFGVIFVYYMVMWTSRALAIGSGVVPSLAPWMPNIVLGVVGLGLLLRRAGSADQPIRISIPMFWRHAEAQAEAAAGSPRRRPRVVVVLRVPHLRLPRPGLLDLYVSKQYLRVFFLGIFALLGIFYVSTFMDLADKLFRGTATTGMLLRFFYFQTPQYVYYVIPMAALVATLVTIGLMTKNSELIVMRACGISLYRTALPLLLFALGASAVLFGLQEQVLASANREADRLNRIIRGFPPQSFGLLDRRWMIGRDGDIYHYEFFDPRTDTFSRFSLYHLDTASWRLGSLTYAAEIGLAGAGVPGPTGERSSGWAAHNGWTREFARQKSKRAPAMTVVYTPFVERTVALESPAYFRSMEPDAEQMSYGQLKSYVTALQSSGAYAVPYLVALQKKVAFPFVTVVMTLLAVPFAVTTGRRGALYGVGIGIVLAIVYWITLNVFAALGSGGLIAPVLAAWAPNILFAAAAVYLLLTVRT